MSISNSNGLRLKQFEYHVMLFLIVGEYGARILQTILYKLHIETANYQYNFASSIFQVFYQWQAHTYIQVIGQIGYNTEKSVSNQSKSVALKNKKLRGLLIDLL